MKQYGLKKATEFSRKQIGAIFAAAKNGELKVEKWVIGDFYNLADYYGYDDNGSVEQSERKIMNILEAVFSKDLETAQSLINDYTEKNFALLSIKNQQNVDREFLA